MAEQCHITKTQINLSFNMKWDVKKRFNGAMHAVIFFVSEFVDGSAPLYKTDRIWV